MRYLQKIVALDSGVYAITVAGPDEEAIVSRCFCRESTAGSAHTIQSIQFESDQLQKAIMRGDVDAKALNAAITAFHKAAKP